MINSNNKIIYIALAVLILLIGGISIMLFINSSRPTSKVTTTPTTKPIKTVVRNTAITPLPTSPKLSVVTLQKTGFIPASVSVAIGEIVTWNNESGEKASISSDPVKKYDLYPQLNLGQFDSGSSVQTRFDKAGTYTYHNFFNEAQKGTIIVE